MQIVLVAALVIVVLALIIFPGVREKLKVLAGGFLNIFVEDKIGRASCRERV